MSEEEHEYQQLVQYHRVRWLSLKECVQRFADLLPEIVQYFEHESQNTAIRPSECAKLQEFHDELVDPMFQLYLYFLQGRLPLLASINTQLQKRNQDLFTVYQKVSILESRMHSGPPVTFYFRKWPLMQMFLATPELF